MKVLVINAGSSSLKYQLIEMDGEQVIAKGLVERIGLPMGNIAHKTSGGAVVEQDKPFANHKDAFLQVVEVMTAGDGKVIDSKDDIFAIGHRVVHGGEVYKTATLVDESDIDRIYELKDLSPLHNPPEAVAMRAAREVFGESTPNVAVFDTSFHQTMPQKAFMFGVPYEYYENHSVRRYGFHGTSHLYVSRRYFEITGKDPKGTKLITCHLGNGSSITAIKDGESADTSMGLTPLDGFIMGTRSGGIDPSVVTFIANKENKSPSEMDELLNKKSGFLGLSGVSSDMRDVRAARDEGNARAALTVEMLVYQIKKFIGGYAAAMNGVDAVIFTGGIGENVDEVRERVCRDMEYLGLSIDSALNAVANQQESEFSTPDSKVKAMVIPTNEEIMIARETLALAK